jgi:hypothetical protein
MLSHLYLLLIGFEFGLNSANRKLNVSDTNTTLCVIAN